MRFIVKFHRKAYSVCWRSRLNRRLSSADQHFRKQTFRQQSTCSFPHDTKHRGLLTSSAHQCRTRLLIRPVARTAYVGGPSSCDRLTRSHIALGNDRKPRIYIMGREQVIIITCSSEAQLKYICRGGDMLINTMQSESPKLQQIIAASVKCKYMLVVNQFCDWCVIEVRYSLSVKEESHIYEHLVLFWFSALWPFGRTYCHHLQGDWFWFMWIVKWTGRMKSVGYMGTLTEIWPMKSCGRRENRASIEPIELGSKNDHFKGQEFAMCAPASSSHMAITYPDN
jgi:hypothetical protein